MSEPFGLEEGGAQQPESQPGGRCIACNVWQTVTKVWRAIWEQTLFIRRRGETVVQVPLALAIILAVVFPHAAALILVVGIIAGYSITVSPK